MRWHRVDHIRAHATGLGWRGVDPLAVVRHGRKVLSKKLSGLSKQDTMIQDDSIFFSLFVLLLKVIREGKVLFMVCRMFFAMHVVRPNAPGGISKRCKNFVKMDNLFSGKLLHGVTRCYKALQN